MITRIEEAAERIAPYIVKTPLSYTPENDLFLKWENYQVTGSFKARGALNKVLTLSKAERARGLVTASAGNHGQGVALAGKTVGAPAIVFVSKHAVPAKVEAMRSLGADVRLIPGGYGEAEQTAIAYSQENDAIWVSPYNDEQVIAGQGTLGLDICQDLPPLPKSTWIVPAGGGGLLAGIGTALSCYVPHPTLIAVQSKASPFLHDIFHKGTQEGVIELPSLADGLAGPVEAGSMTIEVVNNCVDEFILVSEQEIKEAIAFAWHQYSERIEGSAACALAAVLSGKIKERPAVVIITGGNIQPEVHDKIVSSL